MVMIPCNIRGVFMKVTDRGAVPTVVLDTKEGMSIPIYVGLWEALSISNALRGEILPRPITHDLFTDLLEKCAIDIKSLQVDSLEDGVFYSKLLFSYDGRDEMLDCRPSDGIAIALRVQAPIFVDEAVNNEAGVGKDEIVSLKDINSFL